MSRFPEYKKLDLPRSIGLCSKNGRMKKPSIAPWNCERMPNPLSSMKGLLGQWYAGDPPCAGPHDQGSFLSLPNTEGKAGGAKSRLGYPRPAHRTRCGEGVGHHQGRHRKEHQHRRVQRCPPQGGDEVHRSLAGTHRAHGLLGQNGRPLHHLQDQIHRKRSGGSCVSCGTKT